jgi:hypothetical protein
MGKEYSGKKSPAVMILPFSPAPAGARKAASKSIDGHRINHRFIFSFSFDVGFKFSIGI